MLTRIGLRTVIVAGSLSLNPAVPLAKATEFAQYPLE
jgi:hypothetical protein